MEIAKTSNWFLRIKWNISARIEPFEVNGIIFENFGKKELVFIDCCRGARGWQKRISALVDPLEPEDWLF